MAINTIKVLAIDDNFDNLISIKAVINDVFENATVYTASSGLKGIEIAIREDPDVILLDIIMPEMDGYEVCRKLKANPQISDIPVVFVTAIKGDKSNRIIALESGAEGFLAKPIDASELTAVVRAMSKIKNAIVEKRHENERLTTLVEEKTFELMQAHRSTLVLLEELRMENEERKKQALKLNHMSFHDGLTELYNRRYFEEALVRLDVLENLPITIAMGDINGLKAINELCGHKTGDALLKKTAEMLSGSFRESDIIARLGGDEFVVLMTRTDAMQAELLINKFKEHSNREKPTDMDLSISFGYETKRHIDEDIQDVLIKAEDSMYRFKLYESKSLRSKTIEVIMNALVEKSSRELMHSKRVSILCEKIAKHLYYKNEFINQIRIAGLVHDIGKIGIDEKILNKKSSLDDTEWESIRKHPEAGWRILSSVKEFSELAEFIFSHHERWDGKGYPRGLKAEKIPVEARIITIADSYDAMTSNRSYRTRLSEDDAIEELKSNAGLQFDPEITKVFVEKVLEKKW